MRQIKKSASPVILFFVAQPDGLFSSMALGAPLVHGEGVTGLAIGAFTAYMISKNGSAPMVAATIVPGSWKEVGYGWYSVQLDPGDTGTVGTLVLHITVTGYPQVESIFDIVENIASDIYANVGVPVALDSGTPTIAGMLTKMADDNGGADFNAGTDSLHESTSAAPGAIADAVFDEDKTGHTGSLVTDGLDKTKNLPADPAAKSDVQVYTSGSG
jgi:hypothetical protein